MLLANSWSAPKIDLAFALFPICCSFGAVPCYWAMSATQNAGIDSRRGAKFREAWRGINFSGHMQVQGESQADQGIFLPKFFIFCLSVGKLISLIFIFLVLF